VSLLALFVSVTLAFGANGVILSRVDVDPWLLVRVPGAISSSLVPAGQDIGGIVFPQVVWASSDRDRPGMLEHEFEHVRQSRALSAPVFTVAYVLTGGRPFDDYRDGMWLPPEGSPRVSFLSWTPTGGIALWGVTSESQDLHGRGVWWAGIEHPGRAESLAVPAVGGLRAQQTTGWPLGR
jgi:hypothetical protein